MSNINEFTNKFNYIKSGPETKMVMIDYDTNWIQFLQRLGYRLYYKKGIPAEIIKSINSNTVAVDAFLREDIRTLGLLKELCIDRGKGNFTMPLFAIGNQGKWSLTCGNSRALANRICCVPYEDYDVVYVSRDATPEGICQEIQSLDDFESMFDIAWMDYSIGLARVGNNDYHVTGSVIRHTVYDFTEANSRLGYFGERCYDFWKYFVNGNQQIPITITCTEQSKNLIVVDSVFDVTWDLQADCKFRFQWMLEKYQKEGDNKLYCLINSVTESFILHSIIPFMHRDYTGYHTEDKKLALISPHARSSFQIIPNIVK